MAEQPFVIIEETYQGTEVASEATTAEGEITSITRTMSEVTMDEGGAPGKREQEAAEPKMKKQRNTSHGRVADFKKDICVTQHLLKHFVSEESIKKGVEACADMVRTGIEREHMVQKDFDPKRGRVLARIETCFLLKKEQARKYLEANYDIIPYEMMVIARALAEVHEQAENVQENKANLIGSTKGQLPVELLVAGQHGIPPQNTLYKILGPMAVSTDLILSKFEVKPDLIKDAETVIMLQHEGIRVGDNEKVTLASFEVIKIMIAALLGRQAHRSEEEEGSGQEEDPNVGWWFAKEWGAIRTHMVCMAAVLSTMKYFKEIGLGCMITTSHGTGDKHAAEELMSLWGAVIDYKSAAPTDWRPNYKNDIYAIPAKNVHVIRPSTAVIDSVLGDSNKAQSRRAPPLRTYVQSTHKIAGNLGEICGGYKAQTSQYATFYEFLARAVLPLEQRDILLSRLGEDKIGIFRVEQHLIDEAVRKAVRRKTQANNKNDEE